MSTRRTTDEPAFVLHRYDWSETSLVLEVFTRHHGRIAMVAKGVKRPTSQFRPVLLPLQPIRVNWSGDAEVRNLKAAQWSGGHVMPTGEALISGAYLNELLMKLLARDDPHPRLFDHFATAIQLLAERPQAQHVVLRAFELLLLRAIGLLPDLTCEGQSLTRIEGDALFVMQPEAGLRAAHADDHHALPADRWVALQQALEEPAPFLPTLKACADCANTLRIPLRDLLHYHAGVRVFRTRQLMLDVQALSRRRIAPSAPPTAT